LKDPFESLWEMALKLFNYHEKWMNGPFLSVNAEEVELEVILSFKSHNFIRTYCTCNCFLFQLKDTKHVEVEL